MSINNVMRLKSTSDGWRGIMADTFNFNTVKSLGICIAKYIISERKTKNILIAYDTRFLSKEFAQTIVNEISSYGIKTYLVNKPIPTPMLSFRINQLGLFCGLIITASHNPYIYNGIKIRMRYGGPPSSKVIAKIESYFTPLYDNKSDNPVIEPDNPIEDYVQYIRSLLDMNAINKCKKRILIDPMYGTTVGLLKYILSGSGVIIDEIHSNNDPYFGGNAPEPQQATTIQLQNIVSQERYDLGIAHDGDGDRITATLPQKGYISPHEISAILLWYLATEKQIDGIVVGSITLSRRVEKLANYFNYNYHEIPIGFRNASSIMRKRNVLIAAEENGGIGFGFNLPERDATLAAAILVEAEIKTKGGISYILQEVERIAGFSGFCRLNFKVPCNQYALIDQIKSNITGFIPKRQINSIITLDGLKLCLKDGSWVCIRPAGTEDLIRVYAESDSDDLANELAEETKLSVMKEINKKA